MERLSILRHDSPLGRWQFATWAPGPPLTGLVEMLWASEGRVTYGKEKVLPNGAVELLINLGAPHRLLDREDPTRGVPFHRAWVSGVQRQYLLIEAAPQSCMMGVRFRPLGAFAFLGVPMEELSDRVVDLDLILGPGSEALRQRLLATSDLAARFRLLEASITLHCQRGPRPDNGVSWALGHLRRTTGRAPIGGLSRDLGISERHFIRRFRRQVGLAPKLYARVLRFHSVVASMQSRQVVNWADVAQLSGYYDQAHFNRDFRAFSGGTPSDFLARNVPDGGGVRAD
jgi:AraC-like DNA-binding protein